MNVFDIINVPFGYIIKLFYELTQNYAVTLFLFAIVIKLVLFPFGIKQQKNQVKQAKLRPKEAAIRKKYAGRTDKATQQKVQQEIMEMYQREKFNPMGGCLPLLVQFPIIIALYQIVRNPLRYICNLQTDVIEQIYNKLKELIPDVITGTYAQTTQINMINVIRSLPADLYNKLVDSFPKLADITLPNFTAFGLDLSLKPEITNPSWLLIIPVLTFVVSYLSMKYTRRYTYQPNTAANTGLSMKIMDISMPLFSVYMTFLFEATIGLYWVFQNLLAVVQTYILAKMYPLPEFTEADFKAAEKEYNVKAPKKQQLKQNNKVRSLHRIDEDDDDDISSQAQIEDEKTVDGGSLPPAKLKDDERSEKKYKEK